MFANFHPSIVCAATMLSITLGLSSNVSANHHDHIDRVALRIQKKAQRLLEETTHYRHTPQYRHLVHDARLLRDTAIHIHDVTHFEGNIPHLKRDVAMIDQTFHHLEGLFDHIELEAAHGHGHIHGNTRHVKNLLKQIGRDIHHLRDDLAKICEVPHSVQRQPYRTTPTFQSFSNGYNEYRGRSHNGYHNNRHHGINQHNVYRNPNARTARGFSIGGGSTRIWIGF